MALAILELVDFGRSVASFNIDTGTNRHYVLKVGRSWQKRSGVDWIYDITYTSPAAINENGGSLFRSSKEVALPVARFAAGARFVQLFTFKSPDHRSAAFSKVVELPGVIPKLPPGRLRSPAAVMSLATSFERPRSVPCRLAADEVARSASLEDILTSVVNLAAPFVGNLLKGAATDGAKDGSGGGGGDALGKALAALLQSLLGDHVGKQAISTNKSLSVEGSYEGNRFAAGGFSRPFIFGIDDALIGTLAGPILNILPQLLNSANQHKLQMKQANDKLISDLVSDVNKRMMLQQLASAQPPAADGSPADLAKLLQMLQQAAAAAPAAAASVKAQSLSMTETGAATLSARAILTFIFGDPLPWNGSQKLLFAKGTDLHLKVQLTVGEPAPKRPLPKAIIKVVFKDSAEHSVLFEKTFKQKGVAANSSLVLDFSAAELASLPGNRPLDIIAQMRWLSAAGSEFKALGSSEIVLVGKYSFKSQGAADSAEVELTDMKRFRPFWNKLWESPVLDAARSKADEDAKSLWELDVNVRYSVLLSAEHESNGLMETRLLQAPQESESLTQRTAGRMKAGIELSVSELNKLLPLWNDQPVLEPAKLEAFKTAEFAKANATELITTLKLNGRSAERGMVWAVPVFSLTQCTLSAVSRTDESGQVVALSDERVRMPLPVAVRVIGLKSHQ